MINTFVPRYIPIQALQLTQHTTINSLCKFVGKYLVQHEPLKFAIDSRHGLIVPDFGDMVVKHSPDDFEVMTFATFQTRYQPIQGAANV